MCVRVARSSADVTKRSVQPPFGGAARGGRATSRFLALFLATALNSAGHLAIAQRDACADTFDGLRYSVGADTKRDAQGTSLRPTFHLIGAAEPADVAMLAFADGVQRHGPDPVRTVACGETAAWSVHLPHPAGTPLDVHVTPHPSPAVPEAIREAGPDRSLSPADAVGYAYDQADMRRVAFGEARPPPPGLASTEATRAEAPLPDAYLYDRGTPRAPASIHVLPAGEEVWRFGLWYGESARHDGPYALTCLLNDRQFAAFEGRLLWYGKVPRGTAALIPARTPPLSPGWHQVRCLVLDRLFTGEDPRPTWPYVIRSTFVYRRP